MLDRSVVHARARHQPVALRRARRSRSSTFLQNKPEGIDRVGLVGFSSSSLILSYLTRGPERVAFYLDWIRNDPQTLLGTDIGAALKNAREVARKDDRPTRKLFLLISDGEDYGSELTRQMARLRSTATACTAIGIGSENEVPIPVIKPDGREAFLRDDGGPGGDDEVRGRHAAADRRETGGRYVRSSTGASWRRRSRTSSRVSARFRAGGPPPSIGTCMWRRLRAAAAAAALRLWLLI